ncbi:MAG: hypothetical protein LBT01_04895 [Spirochaetaceae bacterium]|jgi:hypothetical protein|nr:hypothetical protein [Spirochaetaceae bacterium]
MIKENCFNGTMGIKVSGKIPFPEKMLSWRTRGRKLLVGLVCLFVGFIISGCNNDPEDIWLARKANPFLGKWEAAIPSMGGAILQFDYKTDGTFEAEFMGQTMTGGYLVTGNQMFTYLSFEGIAEYSFKVVDNNTISVTEWEDGAPEGTTSFIRTANYWGNWETVMSNSFLGKWNSTIPSMENAAIHFDYKLDGTFDWSMDGFGVGVGSYFILNSVEVPTETEGGTETVNIMVSYLGFEGAAGYTFVVTNDNTIAVTEIESFGEGGVINAGSTTNFVRVVE